MLSARSSLVVGGADCACADGDAPVSMCGEACCTPDLADGSTAIPGLVPLCFLTSTARATLNTCPCNANVCRSNLIAYVGGYMLGTGARCTDEHSRSDA